jgi:hypothetical protein
LLDAHGWFPCTKHGSHDDRHVSSELLIRCLFSSAVECWELETALDFELSDELLQLRGDCGQTLGG